ncbi:hypothetical protein CWC05_12000 [Pseudoalteromonas ruthenica]|uniref:Uncharacterized protein n=1 Tax=Pseudoalteromonas ruthenica TaxID=151081 RepID=A0A5S3Z3X2_9GAMM|nr:hypothetical protein [Pseudoalteromonas ruthenica]TMP86731.1 hypothetical protein CWC05_12000 [Pseudoalteromonas ruthenica]
MKRTYNPKYKKFVDNASRSPGLCIHLKDNIESESEDIEIYPIYEQNFLSDSFLSFWFCEKCRNNYNIPESGIIVYHKDFDTLSFLDEIELENPYKKFINENINHTVRSSEFFKKYKSKIEKKKKTDAKKLFLIKKYL